MKEQLIQYVELLFAGTHSCEEMKQEILQNTLDRYDDLISEGKTPEAAYRLAIIGIGDMGEILGASRPAAGPGAAAPAGGSPRPAYGTPAKPRDTVLKKILRAIAVGLYILSPIPLFVLSDFLDMGTIGLCGTLSLVAVATALMVLGAKRGGSADAREEESRAQAEHSPRAELRKSISSVTWAVGFALYFVLSFATNAWHITWVIFPIIGAVSGLITAILDLQEAYKHEN